MRLITFLILALIAGCSSTPTPSYYLTVLHTNDHHGRFWQNDDGEYGMAARQTLLNTLRAEAKAKNHALILLSGGDINTGVPESDLQHAEPDFKGMSLLGYDAMAIGNHEFDNPLSVLEKQHTWANFPLLSANIIHKQNGKNAYQPYTIIKRGGLTIGIIGLTTTDTAKIGNPEFISDLEFINPTQAANKWLAVIKEKYQPNITIAVTHMGHFSDANHKINAPGDVTLARNLPAGMLNLIVGGHSQEPVCMIAPNVNNNNYKAGLACKPDQQNGTWIIQAHEWGKYVGKAEFKITGEKVELISYQLIPVNLKNEQNQWATNYIEPDQAMLKFLTPYQQQGQAKLGGKIASTQIKLQGDRNKVRFEPTNLAQLITKAQMQRVKADFALISGGGIRSSIKAGDISYKDILKVHPFKNRLTYIDFTPAQALTYIKKVSQFPADSGAYPHFYNLSPVCHQGELNSVLIKGKPLESFDKIRMSVNSYNASGGDGYPRLDTRENFVATNEIDAEVLKQYLTAKGTIHSGDLTVPHAITCQ